MKRSISLILAAVTLLAVAVPAVAANAEPVKSNAGSYDWSGTGVDLVIGKDKWGNTVWVRGTASNSPVKELSDCPEMDYVKTIEGVTFSNYIRHTTRNSKDADGNAITVYQVYIGLNGAMRSDKDNVEFINFLGKSFNEQNPNLVVTHGSAVNPCEDLNAYKTNTATFYDRVMNSFFSLSDIGITPYADGGNYGRAMDGTWKKNLTWVFGRYYDGEKSNGTYTAVYPIRVNQGDDVTYFQVAVTDGTNYSGDRNHKEPINPVTPAAPVENVTAIPNTSPVYIDNCLTEFEAYTINQNNYFKLRDVALVLRGTKKQFNVTWNGDVGAIDMKSHTGYLPVGGEMSRGNGLTKQGVLNKSPLYKDGKQVAVTGYTINQNNFFKLRDLGELFDFNVSWNSKLNAIEINTNQSYDPNN